MAIVLPRVLTAAGAERIGYTPARIRTELRRGRWQRLAAGMLLTRPDDPTRLDWAVVGTTLGGSGSAVTGWDVLRFHGLASPTPAEDVVRVLIPRGRNRRVGGVRLAASERPWTARLLRIGEGDDVPIVDVARAVTDTALATDDERAVRALVSSAVQRRLCSPDRLLAELSTAPRHGSKSLRVALADVVAGARSVAEAEARDLLCARRAIPPFDINAAVRDRDGVIVAVADFLWQDLRAVVEIDSREFHFDEASWKATMTRHNRLTRLGYALAHYPPSEVRRRGPAWAAEVEAWLVERRRELTGPR